MIYIQPFPNLYLIDLDQEMTGFRKFISAWLYHDDEVTFLVDPGPKHSIESLIDALKQLQIDHIDTILLTHIHIDHAGGTGRLLEIYPDASIICHPRGIDHMIEPEKLWQGSLQVLGDIARGYGEIIPVPKENIRYEERIRLGRETITVTETPGHAAHHLSFSFREFLFAGEVAGVNYAMKDKVYARPATPPRFKLEVSLDSLDRAIALDPDVICFGHYGYSRDPMPAMQSAREQLELWTETVREELATGSEDLEARIISTLISRDPSFASLNLLEADIRTREDYFVGNSIRGMLGYVKSEQS